MANVDIEKALLKACLVVENAAKLNCTKFKVQTGHLRDSIHSRVNKNVGTVGTNVFYAPYVEFGTGSFARDGDGRPGWWVYVKGSTSETPKSFRKIYTYEQACWIADRLREQGLEPVITRGQHPKPYLQPALLDNREKIIKVFAQSITEQALGGKV